MQGLRIGANTGEDAAKNHEEKEYIGMRRDEMEVLRTLGEGTSGVVQLVKYTPTQQLMALKVISLGMNERERKQILQELRVLHRALVQGERSDERAAAEGTEGSSAVQRVPSIISFIGAFYADGAIHIALEYMDRGSLHDVLLHRGPIEERVLACVAKQVLHGLEALQELKIVHRDVKPANVLLNSQGEIKLADLGMCGELANTFSRLRSWVGTAAYMSPERINGSDYSFNSDVWSLGIALWECASGRFPFGNQRGAAPAGAHGGLLPEEATSGMTFWELLHNIVENDVPELDPAHGSADLRSFLARCLTKDPSSRPEASTLLKHPFIQKLAAEPTDMRAWVKEVLATMPDAGIAEAART